MTIYADLHLHSKHSRATSKELDIDNLEKWARVKGLNLLGTGDFTHPTYLGELKAQLEPTGRGLFRLKNQSESIVFMLTGARS